jgi:outer membrane biosynthesis protein TonB
VAASDAPAHPPGTSATQIVSAAIGLAGYTTATFDSAARSAFTAGIAAALHLAPSAVTITSVTDYAFGTPPAASALRRRVLQSSVGVEIAFDITVTGAAAADALSSSLTGMLHDPASADAFVAALQAAGLKVSAASLELTTEPTVTASSEPPPPPPPALPPAGEEMPPLAPSASPPSSPEVLESPPPPPSSEPTPEPAQLPPSPSPSQPPLPPPPVRARADACALLHDADACCGVVPAAAAPAATEPEQTAATATAAGACLQLRVGMRRSHRQRQSCAIACSSRAELTVAPGISRFAAAAAEPAAAESCAAEPSAAAGARWAAA